MHEYALALNIIETATKYAGGGKVKKISLAVGEACGAVGDSINMYFGIFAENTACEGARLEMDKIKPKLRCKKCGAFFERKPFSFECACGGDGEPTDVGRELFITSIEVES